MSEAAEKKVVPAQIRPETKRTLDGVSSDLGTPQIETLARLVEWFDAQPDAVKVAILRRQDANEEVWRLRQAEKMAQGRYEDAGADATFDQAMAVARQMLDQATAIHRAYERELGGTRKGRGK